MLTLKDNILTQTNETIKTAEHTFYLSAADLDVIYFGVLTLSDGSEKTIEFSKTNEENRYYARVVFLEEDLSYLSKVMLKIISISGNMSKQSNQIKLNLNVNTIKQSAKVSKSKEITQLKKEILELKSSIEALKNVPLSNITIINKDFIHKGMIPVATENGTFIAMYPFNNLVNEVNGVVAENGVVKVGSDMIEYKQGATIKETLTNIVNALNTINTSIQTLSNNQTTIMERLDELELSIEANTNSSII